MNRKFTGSITMCCSALLAVFVVSKTVNSPQDSYCDNVDNQKVTYELPNNHPLKRCAELTTNDVSWLSWFSGKSPSYQFHYLDLLELLSRSSDTSLGQNRGND